MESLLFYLFSGLALLCGLLVVANPFSRNPVTSAMFLVLSIVSLAGLFVLLHAFFLAAVQILVYAGAVMVLFLFVIMLLDLDEHQRRKLSRFGLVTGILGAGAFAMILLGAVVGSGTREGLTTSTLEGRTAGPSAVLGIPAAL
ncbi:MAG: NADH-quinone oxidoreductase subunit J [Verrucomicrobia bacterium]|nr:NADH-quinone oxidoreductase subunit J [Verrucomicrobiota bacterium]